MSRNRFGPKIKIQGEVLDVSGDAIDTAVGGTVAGRDIATDGTKLDGIEALADVTDETNVKAALDGATITSATVATGDKVLIQDVDDSDNLKTVTAQSIADLGGGGGGDFVKISTQDASASSTLSFTGLSATYDVYILEVINLYSNTDADFFVIDVSTDGGSTWLNTNYSYSTDYHDRGGQTGHIDDLDHGTAKFVLGGQSTGNATNEQLCMTVKIFLPSDTAHLKILADGSYDGTDGEINRISTAGKHAATTDVDAIRVWFASGTMTAGTFTLYGAKA